ncbi:MarR family winged helix-turn-helix transcriptional regulator [Virgibacillus soli]|uniref:MarR family transcriptional regulator n=1 Tax=Paracerasibacillus soli TaxID=480284 RepID=A0ABU5CSQ9_9BACI|nr:MarR family transcriptional regulator [Virgibacillus soli]MDY0409366.1 MarR family transcriptional regulator [Virgibacillus soli]
MENKNIFKLIRTLELLTNETIIKFTKSFNLNVGIPQILVLNELAQKGPQMQSALAAEHGYTPGAMTNIADKLIKEGYAVRKFDESDRRIVLLAITEQGLAVLKRAEEKGKEMRMDLYSVLTEEEVEQLILIKEKLLDSLSK